MSFLLNPYTFGENIVTDGLLFHWDAANPSSYPGSGTTVYDLSGANVNGTLTNGPVYSNGYFTLDGSNDTINTTFDLRRTWSYECWVYMNAINNFAFLGNGTTSTRNGLHVFYYSNTRLRFGMYSNDTDYLSTSPSANTWYQFIFTYNHSSPFTKQLYINGVAQSGSIQQTQNSYTGTGVVRVGATYSSGGAYANGRFSIMRLYGKILSNEEIQQNFLANRGRYGI